MLTSHLIAILLTANTRDNDLIIEYNKLQQLTVERVKKIEGNEGLLVTNICEVTLLYYHIYQPLRSGRIWQRSIFKRSLTGLNSEFSFS